LKKENQIKNKRLENAAKVKEQDEKIKVELSDGTTANLNIKSIEQVLDQKKNENINS
jgi:molecular chaperone DnaK (HSP70)